MIAASIKIYLLRLCTLLSAPCVVLEDRDNPGSFQSTALLEARSRTSSARLFERRKESSQAWVFINYSTWIKEETEIWRQHLSLKLVKKNSGDFFEEKKAQHKTVPYKALYQFPLNLQHENHINS